MASLALLVSLIFLVVLFSGPLLYVIYKLDILPSFLLYILSILTIAIGTWWFLLPIPAVRFLGLVPIFIGVKVIFNKHAENEKNKTQA
jgi:cadmium resistance protein CadD (predicted permease)